MLPEMLLQAIAWAGIVSENVLGQPAMSSGVLQIAAAHVVLKLALFRMKRETLPAGLARSVDYGNLASPLLQRVTQLVAKIAFEAQIEVAEDDNEGFEEVALAAAILTEQDSDETGALLIEVEFELAQVLERVDLDVV